MISKYLHVLVRDNVVFDHQVTLSVMPEKNIISIVDTWTFLKVAVVIYLSFCRQRYKININ